MIRCRSQGQSLRLGEQVEAGTGAVRDSIAQGSPSFYRPAWRITHSLAIHHHTPGAQAGAEPRRLAGGQGGAGEGAAAVRQGGRLGAQKQAQGGSVVRLDWGRGRP